MISDKKMSTKMNVLIYKTVVRPTLLYGCETWSMSVKDKKRKATTVSDEDGVMRNDGHEKGRMV